MITNPRLYAVVSRRPAAAVPATDDLRRRKLAEYKKVASAEAEAERKTKQAVDRAAALLDRFNGRAFVCAQQIAVKQAELAVLQASKRIAEGWVERIEDRVVSAMTRAGVDRVMGFRETFATQNTPAAVVVDDMSLLPAQYIRETTTKAPDKVAIKAALNREEEVLGVRLTQKVKLVRK